MNCPNCNSPNADGKKYCADCGTPLDPQMQRLEVFVKEQVEKTIQEKFKDQKLVDIETSQAVAERLHGWAKLFGFFVGLPVAVLLIVLSIGGIGTYSDFTKMIGSIEQQVKPKIEQAKLDAEQAQKTAREAKGDAEDSKRTIENATAEAKRQLGSATELAKSVKALSERVSGLEQQTSNQMKGSSQRVDARVLELNQKIDAATRDIAEQQKKLASTDELVKALFSKSTTEFFQTTANAPNVVIVPLGKGALVFMLLKSAPIAPTIEVKWRVFSQPHNSYWVTNNNILTFSWGDPADNLKQNPLEVTYVPDPTSKSPLFKTLSVKDNRVFADETKLMDLSQ
jgi:hypothetical protein